jgi:hypothetical protein
LLGGQSAHGGESAVIGRDRLQGCLLTAERHSHTSG